MKQLTVREMKEYKKDSNKHGVDKCCLNTLGGWMEDDGIRLQMEAEIKRELTEEEWTEEVKKWFDDVITTMQDCSMTMRDAYLDVLR